LVLSNADLSIDSPLVNQLSLGDLSLLIPELGSGDSIPGYPYRHALFQLLEPGSATGPMFMAFRELKPAARL
jgi:hypothetical protein